ncbi:hypothetical protein B7P43_G13518 [Cryptotermes secundus]|uniref:Uncharacterized protein n=1 Tax=Cryptotermes secundus TaxID=105785 RepID=A0A2J7PYW3_9NEOP|nr:hypothetical protein B7P43_G13518 [Cryptotermes secundus]
MKACEGSGGIAPAFLTSALDRDDFSFTPQPLYPQGKNPWYPLERRFGGLRSWSECCGA